MELIEFFAMSPTDISSMPVIHTLFLQDFDYISCQKIQICILRFTMREEQCTIALCTHSNTSILVNQIITTSCWKHEWMGNFCLSVFQPHTSEKLLTNNCQPNRRPSSNPNEEWRNLIQECVYMLSLIHI